jgi:polysaccharide export outer membrane protein
VIGIRRVARLAACLALGLAAAGCTGQTAPTVAAVSGAEAAQRNSMYVIGPGDTLSIFVYRAPELSVSDLPVRPDGRISVPLIPDIVAAGKTPTELASEIETRLRKYVKEPNVTVIVRSFVGPFSRQVRVIGEAVKPTAIPYRDHMTLLDVMIASGGLTKFAAGNRAVIIRRLPNGQETTLHVYLTSLLNNGNIKDNVEMQPGDTLIIPESWF